MQSVKKQVPQQSSHVFTAPNLLQAEDPNAALAIFLSKAADIDVGRLIHFQSHTLDVFRQSRTSTLQMYENVGQAEKFAEIFAAPFWKMYVRPLEAWDVLISEIKDRVFLNHRSPLVQKTALSNVTSTFFCMAVAATEMPEWVKQKYETFCCKKVEDAAEGSTDSVVESTPIVMSIQSVLNEKAVSAPEPSGATAVEATESEVVEKAEDAASKTSVAESGPSVASIQTEINKKVEVFVELLDGAVMTVEKVEKAEAIVTVDEKAAAVAVEAASEADKKAEAILTVDEKAAAVAVEAASEADKKTGDADSAAKTAEEIDRRELEEIQNALKNRDAAFVEWGKKSNELAMLTITIQNLDKRPPPSFPKGYYTSVLKTMRHYHWLFDAGDNIMNRNNLGLESTREVITEFVSMGNHDCPIVVRYLRVYRESAHLYRKFKEWSSVHDLRIHERRDRIAHAKEKMREKKSVEPAPKNIWSDMNHYTSDMSRFEEFFAKLKVHRTRELELVEKFKRQGRSEVLDVCLQTNSMNFTMPYPCGTHYALNELDAETRGLLAPFIAHTHELRNLWASAMHMHLTNFVQPYVASGASGALPDKVLEDLGWRKIEA